MAVFELSLVEVFDRWSYKCFTAGISTLPNPRTRAAFAQPGSGPAQLRLRSAHPIYAPRRSQDLSHQKSSAFNEGPEKVSAPKLGVPNL